MSAKADNRRRPSFETLEGRELLAANLAALPGAAALKSAALVRTLETPVLVDHAGPVRGATAMKAAATAVMTYDLRPTLGPAVEATVRTFTPGSVSVPGFSVSRTSVSCESLSVNTNGTLTGRVSVQYEARLLGWVVATAKIVVSFSTNYRYPSAGNVVVDIGNIKGAINTGAIKSGVVNWINGRYGDIRAWAAYKVVTIRNETTMDLPYILQKKADGAWETVTIKKGETRWYWVSGPARFEIKFDSSTQAGVQEKYYHPLPAKLFDGPGDPKSTDGQLYAFRSTGTGKWDLFQLV